jgi:hypothetical protein
MSNARTALLLLAIAVAVCWPVHASAQAAKPAPEIEDDPDLDLVPLQPDFTVIAMQTTLRLPRHKSYFRVTHRFGRPLGSGDFGNLLEDFFGLDSGAQIGLEYRFGLLRGTQVGVARTSDRNTEFFVHQDVMQERDGRWVSMTAIATIDGTNNFRDSYSPGLGVVVSRAFAPVGTLFVQSMWVNNSNPLPSELVGDNDSVLVGVGTRLRVRPTVYVVGEIIPRVAGNEPGVHQAAFGIEKRAGGHIFQLNFSNAFGTTPGQIARGGGSNDDWYLGFNISRKFF